MAKYYYEKWSLKWDFSNQSIQTNSRSLYSTSGTVYELNGTMVTRYYRAGDVVKFGGNFGVVTSVTGEMTYFREYKLSDTNTLLSLRVKNKLIDTIIGDDSIYPIDGIAKDTDRNVYWFVRKTAVNQAPVISGSNANLGAKVNDFDINYLVQDAESTTVTVQIKLNDNLIYGPIGVTTGISKSQKINISDLPLGDHKITIIASDDDGASDTRTYTFSKTNTAPMISGNDGDLGSKNSAFSVVYQVWDDNADTLNVTVKINNSVIKTLSNPTHKSNLSVDVSQEMIESFTVNQKNTIEISVSDGKGATAFRKWTFTRTNLPPVISGADKNLGVITNAFEYEYSMTDLENDEIFFITYLDGKVYDAQRTAIPGRNYRAFISGLDFLKLSGGSHVFKIIATDSMGSKSERIITFSRDYHRLIMKLKTPIETDIGANKVLVTPGWQIANGAIAKVFVCNNGFDEIPTWEDATAFTELEKAYVFQNKTKSAAQWGVDIRLEIDRGSAQSESYITGIGGAFE